MPRTSASGQIASNTTVSINVRPGREYVFKITGTWASATASLKHYDGTTAKEIASFTADGDKSFDAPAGIVQIVTTGGGTALAIDYDLNPKHL